jgi:hypothetical protein
MTSKRIQTERKVEETLTVLGKEAGVLLDRLPRVVLLAEYNGFLETVATESLLM